MESILCYRQVLLPEAELDEEQEDAWFSFKKKKK